MRLTQLNQDSVTVEDLEQQVQDLIHRYETLFGEKFIQNDFQDPIAASVAMLQQRLLNATDISHDGIDKLMRDLSDQQGVDVHDLHDVFVQATQQTPDDWIHAQRSST